MIGQFVSNMWQHYWLLFVERESHHIWIVEYYLQIIYKSKYTENICYYITTQ